MGIWVPVNTENVCIDEQKMSSITSKLASPEVTRHSLLS